MNKLITQLTEIDKGYTDNLDTIKQSYDIQLDKYNKAYAELNNSIVGGADASTVDSNRNELQKLDELVRDKGSEIQLVTEYRKAEIEGILSQLEDLQGDYIDNEIKGIKDANTKLQKVKQDYLNHIFTNYKTRNDIKEFEETMKYYHVEIGKPYADTSLRKFDIQVNEMVSNDYEITQKDIYNYIYERTPTSR